MERKCICGETIGDIIVQNDNGTPTTGICINCFLNYLRERIKWLEKMVKLYPDNKKTKSREVRIKMLKTLLIRKVIERG